MLGKFYAKTTNHFSISFQNHFHYSFSKIFCDHFYNSIGIENHFSIRFSMSFTEINHFTISLSFSYWNITGKTYQKSLREDSTSDCGIVQ